MGRSPKYTPVVWILIFSIAAFCFLTGEVRAEASAEQRYYQAEACQRKLMADPRQRQYRDRWLQCIEKFQDVYRHDPDGPWAAAGLYQTGTLYAELFRLSGRTSDRTEALDIFQRIIKRYPKSRYREKAVADIRDLLNGARKAPAEATDRDEDVVRDQYLRAEACYRKLRNDSRRRKYRSNWLRCIEGFREVHRSDPEGPWAAAGLFMAAGMYEELYTLSYKKDDRESARENYTRIIRNYPRSRYHAKSRQALTDLDARAKRVRKPETRVRPPSKPKPEPDRVAEAIHAARYDTERTEKAAQNGPAIITALRHWSNPNYTRIVIDADRSAAFHHRLLKEDRRLGKPPRLYIDLDNCRLSKEIRRTIPINDNLLSDARAGQNSPDAVRVVVDIKSFRTYKIFSLRNPFRIVVDVWGQSRTAAAKKDHLPPVVTGNGKLPAGSLARQLALGVRRIVIDPGHGGKDYGAPGYLKGVHEKRIVLDIARRLAEKIRRRLKCEVVLTRSGDRFLALEERTAMANTRNADLFISIHTNAARDRRAYGIETFFLNLATDEDAILVAARENATSTKNISDLQSILTDLMQNAKINESSRLARHVQNGITGKLKPHYKRIKSKGVKQAPFYVLLGAQMPAILIETSFISNPRECRRLTNGKYQDRLCDGIVKGIESYIRETNPTALRRAQPRDGSRG